MIRIRTTKDSYLLTNGIAAAIRSRGESAALSEETMLATDGRYRLQYTPFEYVPPNPSLVIVGNTPGPNQLRESYAMTQELLNRGLSVEDVLRDVIRVAAFSGPAMRPNLVRLLRAFDFDRLLGIDEVESLWGKRSDLLYSTSVVPHAAFKNGRMFNGSFDEIIKNRVLRNSFEQHFIPAVGSLGKTPKYIALGPTAWAALEKCMELGILDSTACLGAFPHPSTSGGSRVKYYLRQVFRAELNPKDPTRHQADWLDDAYERLTLSMQSLLGPDFSPSIATN